MNSPYMGDFKVTQEYKGAGHDGLDLVGLDSKEIHATVNGVVKAASNTDPKGFGINVKILKDGEDISQMPIEYAPNFTKEYNKDICEELGVEVPDDYVAIGEASDDSTSEETSDDTDDTEAAE